VAWSSIRSPLIALFGLGVTACAALYNLRNDQLYNELVARAAHLERLLNLKDGGFAERPRAWRMAGPFAVSHGQIWWIYLGSLAAWLFIFLHRSKLPQPPFLSWMPAGSFEAVSAVGLILLTGLWVFVQGQTTSWRLKEATTAAVKALRQIPIMSPPESQECWKDLLDQMGVLAGSTADVKTRLLFYWEDGTGRYWDRPAAGETCDIRAAAQLLGLVTDMPSRWIFDVASGRRATKTSSAFPWFESYQAASASL
jgi:hypothetical protein